MDNHINYALFALDSVMTYVDNLDDCFPALCEYYIDFNISPQVPESIVIPNYGFSDLWYNKIEGKYKEILKKIKEFQGQEIEFKEILSAKEAA